MWRAGRCSHCGTQSVSLTNGSSAVLSGQHYCSKRCERGAATLRRRKLVKSARRAPYSRAEILRRDKHRCQLCGGRLAMTKVVPHPKSPVIDHVVPLAAGGDDAPWNVQAAHFLCNAYKSDGVHGDGEQLRLIG